MERKQKSMHVHVEKYLTLSRLMATIKGQKKETYLLLKSAMPLVPFLANLSCQISLAPNPSCSLLERTTAQGENVKSFPDGLQWY